MTKATSTRFKAKWYKRKKNKTLFYFINLIYTQASSNIIQNRQQIVLRLNFDIGVITQAHPTHLPLIVQQFSLN